MGSVSSPRRRGWLLLVAVALGLVPTTIGGVLNPKTAHASSAYETAVLADSPSVYYRLGESGGTTAADDSGNGYDGTYQSNYTLGQSGALVGDSATSVAQSGSGTTVAYTGGTGLPTGNSSRTLELWFKTTTSGTEIVNWGKSGVDTGFGIYLISNTSFSVDDWSSGFAVNTYHPILDGNWHYIVGEYDGTNFASYLDGVFMGSSPLGHSMATTSDKLAVGADENNNESLDGNIQDVAIYSSALTAAQVNAHWRVGNNVSCPSSPTDAYGSSVMANTPSLYYRLNESGGARSITDYSANCRTGTYTMADTTYGVGSSALTNSDASATFAGSSDTSAIGDASDLPSGNSARTVEMWFNQSSAPSSVEQLVEWGTVCACETGFGLNLSSTHISVDDWYHGVQFSPPYNVFDGHWHDVAATYDGTTVVLYLDGKSVGSQAFGYTMATTTKNLTLASTINGGQNVDGSLDEVAIYPTALSANEILGHYFASGNTPAPVGSTPTAAEMPTPSGFCLGCFVRGALVGFSTNSPVNNESGNFYHTFNDVSIPGRSYPLAVVRTYNSQDAATNGPFGYGWKYNYGISLSCSSTTATITQEDGSQVTFDTAGNCSSGSWTPSAPRYLATLVHNGGGTWTFTRQGKDTYTFNSSGQLTDETDLNGYSTSLTYNTGKLDTVTDPAGRTLTFGWTGSNITSVTDANVGGNTRTVTYSYNGSGDLEDVTDLNGGDTHFTYSSHRMTVMKDPVCQALGGGCPGVQNHYDGNGRIDWQKDQLNRETDFSYSGSPYTAAGGSTIITDPSGNEIQEGYQWGVRTFQTQGYGTGDAATTYFTYDPDTLGLTATMDPNGNVTTYTVDSSGNPLTITDPLGRVTTNTYNGFNEVLTSQDPNGVTTTNVYDGNGNLTSTSRPLDATGQTQETDYNYGNNTYPGDVTDVTDPNGKVTYFHYDANGYRDQVKDPLGHVTGTIRNADGWVTASYTPKAACTWNSSPPTGCSNTYRTQYSYVIPGTATTNEFGQVGTVTDPLSHTTEYTYDADGRTLTVQDGNGNDNQNAYDLAGELCWTLPGGTSGNDCSSPPTNARVTDYNPDGTVADQLDGKGNAILTYGYNARGQVTSTTDALSNVTTYTLDANGNVLTKLDPVGGATCGGSPVGCTTYTYDADNELATVSYSDSPSEDITSITYDNDGQRTAMTDGTGSSSWTFDSLHRLTSYTNGNGDAVSYGYTYGGGPSYDLKAQVRSIVYPNSVGTVTQTWNDDGTLDTVSDWNGKTTSFGYDTNANETSQVSPSTTNVTDTFGFNAADQMSSVSDSNGSTLFSATYTRDSNGQLSSDSSQAGNQSAYKYTALNQLCYAGSSSASACTSPPGSSYPYAFDHADNLTTNNGTTQQYNDADQLCWSVSGASANACNSAPGGATTFGYDDKGNRTYSVASGTGTCDTYDQANRLTAVKTGTGSSCTTPTTLGTYAYDGDGKRESKTVTGTTTQFTWSGGETLLQQDAGGTITSFLYGPGGVPIEQIAGGTTRYLHHDQIDSIRLVTDSAGNTGTATTTTFDPYGNVVTSSGSLTTPFGYTGQYLDAESGLYQLRARYYDPTTAQFLTVDPLVAITMQPYQYVAGNPLNATDPSGDWYIPNPAPIAAGDTEACAATAEIPGVDAATCGSSVLLWVGAGVIGIIDLFGSNSDPSNNAGTTTVAPTPDIIGTSGLGTTGADWLTCPQARDNQVPGWWVQETQNLPQQQGESLDQWIRRILQKKYPGAPVRTGGGSEYNKIHKYERNNGNKS